MTTTGEGNLDEMTIDVASYSNHESYNFPDNDITIIELAEAVDLTTYTPACLAKTSDTNTFDGKKAWVYGEITERDQNTDKLTYIGTRDTGLSTNNLNC